jgi:short-subunit dehydrogenase
MLTLDVEDEGSVHGCVGAVLAEAYHLDVLINNAGRMVHGLVDDVPLVEAQRMFETNLWGAARMVNAVLPGMRERGDGQVLMVGSLSNWVTVPMNGFYSASKAALARYTEALRHETMHWGIRVSLIEPSDVTSSIWSRAQKYAARLPGNVPLAERVVAALQSLLDVAPLPTEVARLMVRLVDEKSLGPVYRVGGVARRMPWLRVLLPARCFERGLRKRFGIAEISPNSEGAGSGERPR